MKIVNHIENPTELFNVLKTKDTVLKLSFRGDMNYDLISSENFNIGYLSMRDIFDTLETICAEQGIVIKFK